MFYVYILWNEERKKKYTGCTSNLERRLLRHNKKLKAKTFSYTSKFSGTWILLYQEQFLTRVEANKREKWLKSGIGRDFIEVNIRQWMNQLNR